MKRRTFNNFDKAMEAVAAAERLGMGYVLTKGTRIYTSTQGNRHAQVQWALDCSDSPAIQLEEEKGDRE